MARGDRMGENYDDYLRDDNLHINWYPGHMKKTRDLVRNNLKLVDVVVELLDSRIPFSSRNPDIDNLAGNKPRVVILNKCDLADRAKLDKWIKYYKDRGIKAIPVDTLKGVGLNKLVDECRNAVKDKMDALKEKGRKERPIRIMIVGIPNVGKSSIINKLTGRKSTVTGDRPGVTKGKQWVRLKGNLELLDTPGILWPKFEDQVNKLTGRKSTVTGDRPGVTKGKQWVRLKGNLELLDTPGILWPKFEDQDVALNLAFCRAIKDEILDVETLALRLIGKLMEIEPEKLKARYKLEELGDRDIETMDMIGRKRGFIMGNKELDYTRIATTVLNEFRDGKIGKITLGDRDIETMDMIGRKRGFIMGNKELDYTRIATTVLNEFRDGKIGKITLEVPEDIKK